MGGTGRSRRPVVKGWPQKPSTRPSPVGTIGDSHPPSGEAAEGACRLQRLPQRSRGPGGTRRVREASRGSPSTRALTGEVTGTARSGPERGQRPAGPVPAGPVAPGRGWGGTSLGYSRREPHELNENPPGDLRLLLAATPSGRSCRALEVHASLCLLAFSAGLLMKLSGAVRDNTSLLPQSNPLFHLPQQSRSFLQLSTDTDHPEGLHGSLWGWECQFLSAPSSTCPGKAVVAAAGHVVLRPSSDAGALVC